MSKRASWMNPIINTHKLIATTMWTNPCQRCRLRLHRKKKSHTPAQISKNMPMSGEAQGHVTKHCIISLFPWRVPPPLPANSTQHARRPRCWPLDIAESNRPASLVHAVYHRQSRVLCFGARHLAVLQGKRSRLWPLHNYSSTDQSTRPTPPHQRCPGHTRGRRTPAACTPRAESSPRTRHRPPLAQGHGTPVAPA
jgi:hypothetical protein